MENASKALLMAAEILIAVMIIGVGAYLFRMFASYSSERYDRIAETQVSEFNAQFLKFYGQGKDGKPIECTIHDIVSLANLAQKNNIEYELIEPITTGGNNAYRRKSGVNYDNSLYIQIDLAGVASELELKNNNYFVNLMKQNDLKVSSTGEKSDVQHYECKVCETNQNNKRIHYMKFVKIP